MGPRVTGRNGVALAPVSWNGEPVAQVPSIHCVLALKTCPSVFCRRPLLDVLCECLRLC
jgi:hypothetical protein